MREMSGEPRCEEARRLVWPPELPREHTDRVEAATRHVRACADCRAFFARDRAVAEAIRSRASAVSAPRALRERVYDALARERALRAESTPTPSRGLAGGRAGRWLRGGRRLAAAGLVAAGLVVGAALVAGRSGPVDAYARDFASRAVAEDAIWTADPVAVSRFFMKEMGIGVRPVSPAGAELSRAMICLIEGERAAMVEYEWRGRTVAHYRLPLDRAAGAGGYGRPAPPVEPRASRERGLTVVSWRDDHFEHAVVSDLEADDLLALVRSDFLPR